MADNIQDTDEKRTAEAFARLSGADLTLCDDRRAAVSSDAALLLIAEITNIGGGGGAGRSVALILGGCVGWRERRSTGSSGATGLIPGIDPVRGAGGTTSSMGTPWESGWRGGAGSPATAAVGRLSPRSRQRAARRRTRQPPPAAPSPTAPRAMKWPLRNSGFE